MVKDLTLTQLGITVANARIRRSLRVERQPSRGAAVNSLTAARRWRALLCDPNRVVLDRIEVVPVPCAKHTGGDAVQHVQQP